MDIRVESFSHHLFRYVFHELKVPKEKIYPINNQMVFDDYTDDIGFAVVMNALCFRSDIKYVFDKQPDLVIGTTDFEDVVRKYLDVFIPKKDIFDLTIGSCVLFSEFTVRKYSEDKNFDLTSVPKLWARFFINNFLEEFSRKGDWDDLKLKAKEAQIADTGTKYPLSKLQHPYDSLQAIDNIKNLLPQRKSRLEQFDSLKFGKVPSQKVQLITLVRQPEPSPAGSARPLSVKASNAQAMGKASLKRSAAPALEVPEKITRESPKKGNNTVEDCNMEF